MSKAEEDKKVKVDVDAVLAQTDFYKILDVSPDVEDEKLDKIFRKLSLLYHPDKCKHPKAQDAFIKIKEAYLVLRDKEARAAIDAVSKAQEEADRRRSLQSEKTRKLREELERKEAAARDQNSEVENARKRAEVELARIRKAMAKARDDAYLESLKTRPASPPVQTTSQTQNTATAVISVKWTKKHPGLTKETLARFLSPFGSVDGVVVVEAKRKAMVSLSACTNLDGIKRLEELNPETSFEVKTQSSSQQTTQVKATPTSHPVFPSAPSTFSTQDTSKGSAPIHDYESITLMRIRQMEERKRLAQQMEEEDNA